MNQNKGIIQQLKERQKLTSLIPLDLQFFAARKFKIALSDGHGYTTSGKQTPDGYKENYFNEKVIEFLRAELIRCGFDVLLVAPTSADTPLKARTDAANAWGADVYVSVHYNALGSTWRSGVGGIETYHYPNSASGKKLADILHAEVIKGTPLRNRGVKSANFHELRETKMPAALIEAGFMDIKAEADLMKSAAYQKETAQEIAVGLCKYFGVAYVPEAAPKTEDKPSTGGKLYRVQVGAYGVKANAEDMERQLKARGFQTTIKFDGKIYRVQTGAFSVKANAEDLSRNLKAKGFDNFIRYE